MATLSLLIPTGYGLVVLEALAIGAQCLTEGFAGYATRKRVFSKQFFQTHFPDVKPTPEDGYPDIGYGRYSDKLSDKDWQDLANAQRAHYNYVEQLPTTLTALVSSPANTAYEATQRSVRLTLRLTPPCRGTALCCVPCSASPG